MGITSILTRLGKDLSSKKIADYLGINVSHVYNYYSGYRDPSPTMVQALIDKGLYQPPKRIRSQITWENQEQKDAFTWYVKSLGCESISDYCRDIANSNMEAYIHGINEKARNNK